MTKDSQIGSVESLSQNLIGRTSHNGGYEIVAMFRIKGLDGNGWKFLLRDTKTNVLREEWKRFLLVDPKP